MKAALLSALLPAADAFLLMSQLIAHERADPIVQPDIVSGHIHDVLGASTFGVTFNPDVWSKAKCSTMQVQENKSNYWMPALHVDNGNGTFSAVPVKEARVYYLNNNVAGTRVKAFPQGLRIVAGSPLATEYVPAQPGYVDGNIGYTCQMAGTDPSKEHWQPSIPDFVCKDFLRLSVSFPSCWNGKDLDSADHKSHMSYRFSNGTCPETHPVPTMQIDLEIGYYTADYPADKLLLSTGDRAGFGLHGDYLSFWDVNLLQAALDDSTCQHRENIFGDAAQCQTLKSHRNDAAAQSCKLEANIPQENTGIDAPINALPGCNKPWDAQKGEKPQTCSVAPPVPQIGKASSFYNFNPDHNPNKNPRTDVAIFSGFNPAPTVSQPAITSLVTSTKQPTKTQPSKHHHH
ncbi:hypothetical protein BGZ63DRAFT_461492 [Mariannaea sp. PMI_226]|nr:hypothetical protein BGZ63DRAFT_461492 [Mariannaea sp. PMI_226]